MTLRCVVRIITAVILLAITGERAAVHAQQSDKKLIRIASARGVNFVALWGLGPFAEKHGLRIEMVAAMTNADQQRALQVGGAEVATQGYQNPAMLAEQNVTNVKVIAGLYLGGQNLVMRKGVDLRSGRTSKARRSAGHREHSRKYSLFLPPKQTASTFPRSIWST